MKTILAPVDFSSVSEQVLEVAAELARALQGSVVVFYAVRPAQMATPFEMEIAVSEELTAALEQAADAQLLEFKNLLDEKGVESRVLRLPGYPGTLIVEQARKLSADYIVIGSHSHTALYNVVLGSTTRIVLKSAPCPVIVVPPAKPQTTSLAPQESHAHEPVEA
jgi:nucleotide-binding universal stress UspA family protein